MRLSIQSKPDAPSVLVLSIAGPAGVLPEGAQDVAAGAYAQYGKVGTERGKGRSKGAGLILSPSLAIRETANCVQSQFRKSKFPGRIENRVAVARPFFHGHATRTPPTPLTLSALLPPY